MDGASESRKKRKVETSDCPKTETGALKESTDSSLKEGLTQTTSDDSVSVSSGSSSPLVSIITPAHNAARFLPDAFASVISQTYRPIELCVFDDASKDSSPEVFEEWKPKLSEAGITLVTGHAVCDECVASSSLKAFTSCEHAGAGGAGAARNKAVDMSSGSYLCFLDADDIMVPNRIERQLEAAQSRPRAIVGSQFTRTPEGSTAFYTEWLNGLSQEELFLHQYRECTLILPTWFMAKDVFSAVRFEEVPPGARGQFPEDLVFFNKHLDNDGDLYKINTPLMVYRYVEGSVCFQIPRKVLVETRVPFLERRVLKNWPTFSIWGAGRDGKFFLNQLSPDIVSRVQAICDVDGKKLAHGEYFHQGSRRRIPIIPFSEVKPPLIICVASKCRGDELRRNIFSLGLKEGVDFYHFS